MRLKLTVRLAALARDQRAPYGRAGASAAKAPARSLSAARYAARRQEVGGGALRNSTFSGRCRVALGIFFASASMMRRSHNVRP